MGGIVDWYENDEEDRKKIALQIIQDRLAKKIDLNESLGLNWEGKKPLHIAVTCDNSGKLLKQILIAGADPNVCDSLFDTPLHEVCGTSFSIANIKLLLAHNADPNKVGCLSRIPLHSMMWHLGNHDFTECKKAIKVLLAQGADIAAKNEFGETPLQEINIDITEGQRKEIVQLIEDTILAMRRRKAALFIAAKGKNPPNSLSLFNLLPNEITRIIIDTAYPGTPWPQWQADSIESLRTLK